MQVKKFEAKTMKEALEMVKNQLGPEAIILAARDNNRSFGLLGNTSVEVTAAISETTLQKKKFAESRLPANLKEKLQNSSARVQKQFIEKSVGRFLENQKPSHTITSVPYADIQDEEAVQEAILKSKSYASNRVQDLLSHFNDDQAHEENNPAANRIKRAVQDAASAFDVKAARKKAAAAANRSVASQAETSSHKEMKMLREELSSLKEFIQQMQSSQRTVLHAHPGADYALPFELSFMFERLLSAGVLSSLAGQIMKRALQELPQEQLKNKNIVEAWTAHHILKSISVLENPLSGRIHAFVGGPGQGKTTMLVKLAGLLVSKYKKRVVIVCCGHQKVGSIEQMKIYSQILNAPLEVVQSSADWARVLRQHASADYILADYPGFTMKSDIEATTLQSLLPPALPDRVVHFVVSASAKDSDALESLRRYSVTPIGDLMFTRLDESVTHGLVLNLQQSFSLPLNSFGTGPNLPDDFEFATKERVLDLIFKIRNLTQQGRGEEHDRSY